MARPLNASSQVGKLIHEFKLKTPWEPIECSLSLSKDGGTINPHSVGFHYTLVGRDDAHGISLYLRGDDPNELIEQAEQIIAEKSVHSWEDVLLVEISHSPAPQHLDTSEEAGRSGGMTIDYVRWSRGKDVNGNWKYRVRGNTGSTGDKDPKIEFKGFDEEPKDRYLRGREHGHARFIIADTTENRDAVERMIDGLDNLTRLALDRFKDTVKSELLPSSVLKLSAS